MASTSGAIIRNEMGVVRLTRWGLGLLVCACSSGSGSGGTPLDAGLDTSFDAVADSPADAGEDADAGCVPWIRYPIPHSFQYGAAITLLGDGARVWFAGRSLFGAAFGWVGGNETVEQEPNIDSAVGLFAAGGRARATWIGTSSEARIAALADDASFEGTPSTVTLPGPPALGTVFGAMLSDDSLYAVVKDQTQILNLWRVPLTPAFESAGPAELVDTPGLGWVNVISGDGHSAVLWTRDGALRWSVDKAAPVTLPVGNTAPLEPQSGRLAAPVPGGFVTVIHESPSGVDPAERLVWFDWSGAKLKELELPDSDRWRVASSGKRLLRAKDKDDVVTYCIGDALSGDAKCSEIYPTINHIVTYSDAARLGDGWVIAINDYGDAELHFVCDP